MADSTRKHPTALPFLFFSEMWERFGYYLMIGIFTLYLKDVKAGFGMTEGEASDLYGTFIALVFLTPFLGGLLADRYLGYRLSIILGGLMMGVGYCLMAIHSLPALYVSMALVIVGNGFFKPNISTLLGNVYSDPAYLSRKDEGYNIFYMGINIGAFICNFFGAVLYVMLGWGYAFLAAGVGMFIGVAVFLAGTKHYAGADVKKGVSPNDMSLKRIVGLILLPAVVAAGLGWVIPGNFLGSDSTDAFIFACIPVIYFFYTLYAGADAHEKRPILALLSIFFVVILFWAVFKQNGSALNTWADRYTNREVTGNTEKVFSGLRFAQTLTYSKDSVPLYGAQFRIVKDTIIVKYEKGNEKEEYRIVKTFDYPSYFYNIPQEKRPQEGGSIKVWATNLSQSINPGWVILLTPLVVAFFAFLRKRKAEPSTPAKITWGLFISGLSVLFMVGAVYASDNGAGKANVGWLVASYGVITVGELFLSPMGLSLVSKLSPVRITSLMMGGWFLATSIGNKLSGVLATLWDKYDNKANYFWVNFALLILATFMLLAILRWLNGVMKENNIK